MCSGGETDLKLFNLNPDFSKRYFSVIPKHILNKLIVKQKKKNLNFCPILCFSSLSRLMFTKINLIFLIEQINCNPCECAFFL